MSSPAIDLLSIDQLSIDQLSVDTERAGDASSRPHLASVPAQDPPFDAAARLRSGEQGRRRDGRGRRRIDPATTHGRLAPPAHPGRTTLAPQPVRPGQSPRADRAEAARLPVHAWSGHQTTVGLATVPGISLAGDVGARITPTVELPPARPAGTALARALVEVLTSARPVHQLRTHCTPEVFAGLEANTPLSGTGLARLHSAHVSQPHDGVAEVSAVFRRGSRMRAIAFQITGLDGRWRVTALQVG